MSAYFITSSGTGVGKTFPTCALLHAARTNGIAAQAFKPIISGWDENPSPLAGEVRWGGGENGTRASNPPPQGRRELSDTAQIQRASGTASSVDDISPWRFSAPLSPHRAAALEQKQIDVAALIEWSRAQSTKPGLTLIEGVGGVMVPLTEDKTVRDWMVALKLPVIMVVGSYLGSISHTLTALEVLQTAGLHVQAIVISETAESSVDFAEAEAGLSPFIRNIPLRIFQPRVSSYEDAREIHALAAKL